MAVVDFSPLTQHLLEITFVVVNGAIIFVGKQVISYLRDQGIDINTQNVMQSVQDKLRGFEDKLMKSVSSADEIQVNNSTIANITNELIEESPQWLKKAGFTKGKVKKNVDYDKVAAFVRDQAKSLFGFNKKASN
jgi:hypothetical protein